MQRTQTYRQNIGSQREYTPCAGICLSSEAIPLSGSVVISAIASGIGGPFGYEFTRTIEGGTATLLQGVGLVFEDTPTETGKYTYVLTITDSNHNTITASSYPLTVA